MTAAEREELKRLVSKARKAQVKREQRIAAESLKGMVRLPETERVGSGEEDWHGTPNGYNWHGCRCDECREARSTYRRELRERKREREAIMCPCGVNERPIAPKSNRNRGYVKGERKRFCSPACSLRYLERDEHGRIRMKVAA